MNVWTDWVAPGVALLSVVASLAAAAGAQRARTRADIAAARARRSSTAATAAAADTTRVAALARDEHDRATATVVHVPGPPRHTPPEPEPASDRCASGQHRWGRRDVTNVRVVSGTDRLLCSVTWRCSSCPATRHEQNVPPPLTLAVAGPGVTPSVAARTADTEPANEEAS